MFLQMFTCIPHRSVILKCFKKDVVGRMYEGVNKGEAEEILHKRDGLA